MTVIAFSPNVGPILFEAVLSEDHESNLEITENPIETGAEINDHAVIKPKRVTIDVADTRAAEVYNALLLFQASRIPFVMVTGLTIYNNMLISSMKATRDKVTSQILRATIVMKEIIIVSTGSSVGSGSNDTQPGSADSRRSVTPSQDTATNAATGDKAASTVVRGDVPTTTVTPAEATSLLKAAFS